MRMGALPACMFVLHMCAEPAEIRRGHGIPWSGPTKSYEPPHGCWESKLGPLEKHLHLSSLLLIFKN